MVTNWQLAQIQQEQPDLYRYLIEWTCPPSYCASYSITLGRRYRGTARVFRLPPYRLLCNFIETYKNYGPYLQKMQSRYIHAECENYLSKDSYAIRSGAKSQVIVGVRGMSVKWLFPRFFFNPLILVVFVQLF